MPGRSAPVKVERPTGRTTLTAAERSGGLWCVTGAKHQTVSDPTHVEAAKLLRRKHLDIARPAAQPEVEERCLADYDTALGLTDQHGVA